jgi:hypothetical protein
MMGELHILRVILSIERGDTTLEEVLRDRVKIVVCDTGPILHLHEAAALQLLERAGEVFIPTAVDSEPQGRLPGLNQVWRIIETPRTLEPTRGRHR